MWGEAQNRSLSQSMHFSSGYIFLKLVYCGHTYACVHAFEYQATHYMNDNHRLILLQDFVLIGPYTAELTFLHNTLLKVIKEENEFKIVRMRENHLKVKTLLHVGLVYLFSFSSGTTSTTRG